MCIPTNILAGDALVDADMHDAGMHDANASLVAATDQKIQTRPTVTMSEGSDHEDDSNPPSRKTSLHLASRPGLITGELTDVQDKYRVDPEVIGTGHYGTVRKCMDRDTHEWFAIKTIQKAKLDSTRALQREIALLREMDHPGIIRLVDVHEDEERVHIITELCEGGELFDHIVEKATSAEGRFSEREAAGMIKSILESLDYCHKSNIAHRDIKPENFCFTATNEIKLIDFGLARRHNPSSAPMTDMAGTAYYIAPEVLHKRHTLSCDMWSVGVLAYILLCGYPPFYGDTDEETFASVSRARVSYSGEHWDDISNSARMFVRSLLRKNPSKRMTAQEAMNHPWLQKQLGKEEESVKRSVPPSNGEEELVLESPRKKFKEDAILFGYEVTQTDVESIRNILQTCCTSNESGDDYRCLEPRPVTPTIV